MTTWLFLKAGYEWAQYSSHEKVIEDNKERYYVALRNTQKSFKKGPVKYQDWIEFFLMVTEKQTEFLRHEIDTQLPTSELNQNEMRVLEILKEHGLCSPAFIRKHVSLSKDGLRSLLQRLAERKLIVPVGENRGRKYKASPTK
jgi:Fic family protein